MSEILKSHHPRRHTNSFKYAFKGLSHALANEPNFRIQVLIATAATIMGLEFHIDTIEWSVIILSMGFLLSAEMVNTVVEEFIDHLIKEEHEGARIIKDLAAGFVLTSAIATWLILLLIFGPRIYQLLL